MQNCNNKPLLVLLSFMCISIATLFSAVYDLHESLKELKNTKVVLSSDILDNQNLDIPKDSILIKDILLEVLRANEVHNAEIVYAQAILETGWFKSNLCVTHNNLFGLYDSKNKQYYKFDSWEQSVVAYRKWIQYKHKPNENYYAFLTRIGYAEDPNYINKVKNIHKRIFN